MISIKNNYFILRQYLFFLIILFNLYTVHTNELKQIEINKQDRILVFAPHPDDEVLGCAGILQHSFKNNIPLKIVYLTYGDNNEWSFFIYRKHPVIFPVAAQRMGLVRHSESVQSSNILGITSDSLIFLGYPDFKTLPIWYSHWGNNPPLKSMLTKVKAVPYSNAYRPQAPYKGEEILNDLTNIIQEFKPTKIFLSHPADTNPDHQSLFLFTQIAVWNLQNIITPQIFSYLIHYKLWPKPKGFFPHLNLNPPHILSKSNSWFYFPLSQSAIDLKLKAIQAHKSQMNYSSKYLTSFIRDKEVFERFTDFNSQYTQNELQTTSSNSIMNSTPEELTDLEKIEYIGIQWNYIKIEGNELILSIELSKPLNKNVRISIYSFGYRSDIKFEKMPKIKIQITAKNTVIYNQKNMITNKNILIQRGKKDITIHIPLNELNNPHKILTEARSRLNNIPLDWTSWRILEL